MTSPREPDRVPLDRDRIVRLCQFLDEAQQLAKDYIRDDPTWAGMPGSKAVAETTDPTVSPAMLYELNGAYAFVQIRLQAVLEYAESIAIMFEIG